MEGELLAAIAGLVGLVTGVAAGLAFRISESSHSHTPDPAPQSSLPPGIAEVLAALPSSAVVLDSTDRVLRASSAARAYRLVSGDELVIGELLALARQVRRDGVIRETEIEVSVRRFGPDSTTFAVRVAPLGATGLILVLAEDQTERRRVEAVRRDFVANISHELKTPVGALSLLAETINDASDDPDAVRRFASRMKHEADRLTSLIQDLITHSRIQGAEPLSEPVEVAVDTVVEESLDAVRTAADTKNIELVSGGAEGVTVMGDEGLLITALRNLVANAVAYSPANTRVAVTVRTTDTTVEISVADRNRHSPTRPGTHFRRFYRVDAARSRATGGTGLGLAIVKHIMTLHRGEVTVWSKEGEVVVHLASPRSETPEPPGSTATSDQEAAQ